MLFNSFPFIFGFLPLALAGYWLLGGREAARLWFLLGASVLFYGYWDWHFAPLLIVSIVANWLAAEVFFAYRYRSILIAAITANLLCLGAFKYLSFFAEVVEETTSWQLGVIRLALPLGISFFTFHHIIYLADLMRGRAPRYGFRDYALYIALFPQILAGPLVRHNEIIHQFREPPLRAGWEARTCRGVALFLIGLTKKLFLADALAAQGDPIFAQAAQGSVTIGEAWTAALSFPLQVYFDFSGYSDMAIGLALLLGFALPINFDAPFNATNIAELWRRWHMTLMRFLREYLFVPLGGLRRRRQIAAIIITFALAGLWHGAGWTFIIWGVLQGVAIAATVYWRRRAMPELPTALGWCLMIIFILFTWLLFRTPSLAAAGSIWTAMIGLGAPGPIAGIPTLLIGAGVALLGPTSQNIVERLKPYGWLAPVAALATVICLLKLGDGPAYEFIYFHF
jgi:D-alanyl-lipoteichoic acid acyltransferase DltB (MBOAT superfamily)